MNVIYESWPSGHTQDELRQVFKGSLRDAYAVDFIRVPMLRESDGVVAKRLLQY